MTAGGLFLRKILYCLLDGYGEKDEYRELGGKTPLEYANTPFLDSLLDKSECGFLNPVGLGSIVPISDASAMTFSFLGYDVRSFPHGRGIIEAIGEKMCVKNGDLAMRCNFATINGEGVVVDRRAGRIQDTTALERAINSMKFGVPFEFKATTTHRGILVFKKGRYSPEITSPDPQQTGVMVGEAKPKKPSARRTARLVNEFVQKSFGVLSGHPVNKERKKKGKPAANVLLPRGFGNKIPKLKPFSRRFGVKPVAVTGIAVNTGVCRLLGIPIEFVPEDVGDSFKEVMLKARPVKRALKRKNFVFVHFKTTDLPGHDGDVHAKVREIERVDAFLEGIGLDEKTMIVVGADHCTSCRKKAHTVDPIPYLLFDGRPGKPGGKTFGEELCKKGPTIRQFDLLPRALSRR